MRLSTLVNISRELRSNWNIYRQFVTFIDFKKYTLFFLKNRCVPSVTEDVKIDYSVIIYTSDVNGNNSEREIPVYSNGKEVSPKKLLGIFIKSVLIDCQEKVVEDLLFRSKFDNRWKGCSDCRCYMCTSNEGCYLCGCGSRDGECKENNQSGSIGYCVIGRNRRGVGEYEASKHSVYSRKTYLEFNKDVE